MDYSSKLRALDWSFSGDKSDSPFADLHFYPGRFVPQIPAALIGTLTQPGELVVDPFCGSGTTLVEAQRLGRHAIGIDLNPVACMISRVKTTSAGAVKTEVKISKFLEDLTRHHLERKYVSASAPPSVQLTKWYHPETGRQLTSIWSCIQNQSDSDIYDLAQFCFSASLMAACGETRHWGYICDNVRPLGLQYVDAYAIFVERTKSLVEALRRRELRQMAPGKFLAGRIGVFQGDAGQRLIALGSESVDAIVTSPPYFGVVDYIKSQRLTFEWFGMEIEGFRRNEIGARSKRHRVTALTQYLSEMDVIATESHRVLKEGRIAAYVIGESAKREEVVEKFSSLLVDKGFSIEMRLKRNIGISRRQPASLMDENIILCRKL